jgi:hypothetical protein
VARDFDGVMGSYLVVESTGLNIQYPFSMCCWFNCDLATGAQNIMATGLLNNANHRCWLVARGDVAGDPIQFSRDAAGTRHNTATSTGYTVGQWHLASCNYAAADSANAYIDGGSKGSTSVSRDVNAANDIIVGDNANVDVNSFTGRLAEAAIWHGGVLTDEEHSLLAHGYSPLFVRRDLLVFYAPIIGRASPETEFMGANGLVVNGTAVYADHPRITRPSL